MKTIGTNVDEALIKVNAVDDTIKTHCVNEVSDWVIEELLAFRWPFMRESAALSVTASAQYVALPADYGRINTVRWTGSNGGFLPLEVHSREAFDRVYNPEETGTPGHCAVFNGNIYLYPAAEEAGTLTINYWKIIPAVLEATDDGLFPDAIIKQRAVIAALDYDRLNTETEWAKLTRQMILLRRNNSDDGNDGASIALDPNAFQRPPENLY